MKEVIAGEKSNIVPVQFLNTLKYCDYMLNWLIRNRLVGLKFKLWFSIEMDGSMLEMSAELIRRVEKECGIRTPVRKDFV